MANCLILGADGFLGSHLADRLLELNHHVRAFDRFHNDKPRNLPAKAPRLELFAGNFLNREHLDAALKDIDYVFHFISTTNPAESAKDPLIDVETNIKMSVILFELCAKHGVKRVIFPSTGGAIYGDSQDEPFREDDPTNPVSPYAIGKLAIEKYLNYFNHSHNLDYLILRVSNPYGERQNLVGNQGVVPIFFNLIKQDKPVNVYGDGSMVRDYLYVGDLVRVVSDIFDKKTKYMLYNIGSGEAVSLKELLGAMEGVAGKKININYLPSRPTDAQIVMLNTDRYESEFKAIATKDLKSGLEATWKYVLEQNGK